MKTFSNKIYSYISDNTLEFDDVKMSMIKYDKYFHVNKERLNDKNIYLWIFKM